MITKFRRNTPLVREIGARLRDERAAMGWTQREAAERLGVKQPNLSAMEKGRVCPTIQILEAARTWRGRSLEWLLFGDERHEDAVGESGASYGQPARLRIPVVASTAVEPNGATAWCERETGGWQPLTPGLQFVEVHGDSLEPFARDGQKLLVVQAPAEEGDLVMLEACDGQRFVRRWWPLDGEDVVLESVVRGKGIAPVVKRRADIRRAWRIVGVVF